MLRERPKSIKKEDSKRVSSVGFKKPHDEDHTHKRSITAQKPQKKKKLSKKKKLQQQKRRLDEQQRRLAQIEQKRRQQLEALRLEQFKKLTKEQNQRLQREFPEYYDKCQKFESLAFIAARREKQVREWELYVADSEMIDVDKEKEVHKLVASVNQNLEVGFNYEPFEKWMVLLKRVIDELSSGLREAKASRNHEKGFYYQEHLKDVEDAIRNKIEQYIQYNIDNFDKLLQIKNKQLRQKNLPTLSLDTQKQINQIVFKKSQQRYKYQLTRVILNSQLAKLAIWFNLVKVGYRPKPLTFPSLSIELEIPRSFIQNSTVVCCLKSKTHRYPSTEYNLVGEVFEFFTYPFYPLPRVNAKFTLKKVTEVGEKGTGGLKRIVYEGREGEKLAVKLGIPKGFYYDAKDIKVGLYDKENGWSEKLVSGVEVQDGMVKCEVPKFLPMSILLPKATDCPYRSYFLRCTSTQVATLDLQTRRGIKLQFQIGKTYVKLTNNAGIAQLDDIVGQQLSSGTLIQSLSQRGLMLSLSDQDTPFIPHCKIPQAQNKLLQDLAFVISGFAFKSSPLKSPSPTCILVQAKTHLDFEFRDIVDDLHPWQTYLFTINKCGLLSGKLREFKEEFEKNTVTHINMEKVVRESQRMATEEVLDRFTWVALYPEFLVNLKAFVKQVRMFAATV